MWKTQTNFFCIYGFRYYLCTIMINPLHNNVALTHSRKRIIAQKTLEWCKANMGSRRAKLTLKVRKAGTTARQTQEVGHFKYWCNEMVIHWDLCESVRSIVTTVIHEYTHYLQPMEKHYVELYHIHGYQKHPFEIEARSNEKLWTKCYNEVVKPYLTEAGL